MRLADSFEQTVGGVVPERSSAASTQLETAASSLRNTAESTQQRTVVVAAASEQASSFRCNPLATGVRARSFRGDHLLDNNLT